METDLFVCSNFNLSSASICFAHNSLCISALRKETDETDVSQIYMIMGKIPNFFDK